ncbi:ABC transporter permease [Streptomyces sp. WMMC500]|uniref:FtsX-like permease family protein n=1 Tax=Streptomyces sp. WMMC500 TaxID=3015154 RepID=UPI00248BCE17|nr:FtsX family ABC transporter permease [Streptomyces sp. WMMC500]WBB57825.1 ABC transporter permease [Streptomyces sp. WMMC500]
MAFRTLRHRTAALSATFLALFLGTVIVMTCGGLLETGIRNNAPAQRLAGADLVVAGDREVPRGDETAVLDERPPLDGSLTAAVRDVPGVERAVPERVFDAAVLGGPAASGSAPDTRAHGWSSAPVTPYELSAGRGPEGPRDVVLDEATAGAYGLRPGDEVRVAARGGAAAYRLTGVVRAPHAIGYGAVFFTDDRARALAPAVADIAVTAAPGTDHGELKDRLAEVVAAHAADRTDEGRMPAKVYSGDDRGAVEYPEVLTRKEDLIAVAGAFGGMATVVAVFVVSGAVALSVERRRREFALLRTIGGTPRQLRRLLLAETLLVGLAAAAAGWFAGPAAGERLFEEFTASGMVSEAVTYAQGWIPAVAAGGALLLTALFGGYLGGRRGVKVKPVEAMAEATLRTRWAHPLRIVLAVLFLGGTAALAILTWVLFDGPIAASTAGPTVLCAAIGLALLGPGLTKLCTALISGPVRAFTGVSGELAVTTARARAVRMAGVVTPVMLAVAMATGNLYLQTTQDDATREAYAETLRADAVVDSPAGTLDPALTADVRAADGVAAAGAYVTGTGWIDGLGDEDGVPLQGVDARGAARTTALEPVAGDVADLTGRTIALPAGAADGRGVGDTVEVRFGDGAVADLRIAVLFEGRDGYDTVFVPADLLAGHTDGGLPQQILVTAEEGVGAAELTASLEKTLAGHPGTGVTDRGELIEAHVEDTETQAWVNYLILGMIVAYTAIAVVNNLVLSVSGRRREFGLQRLAGATRRQVLRMLTIEALIVAGIGVGLGTAAAATALVPFSHAAADSVLSSGPPSIYAAIVAGAVALALTATLVPGWAALRTRPAEAAQAEE